MQIDWATIQEWLITSGGRIFMILAIALLLLWIVTLFTKGILAHIEKRARIKDTNDELVKRANTLSYLVLRSSRVLVFFITATLILFVMGINITPILAGAGIAGIAIGLGAQKLINDYLNGFFIFLENQYRVGDVIAAAGVSGIVEAVNLRTTIIRDLKGRVHVVPNSEIKVVTNYTKEYSRYVLDVGVAYKEDVNQVIALLKQVGGELFEDDVFGPDMIEAPEILGVEDFGDSAVVIRTRVTTKTLRQWDIVREFRRRIKMAFDAHNIEIPFPHRTLYYGKPHETQDS